jgi:hypothetical protein
MSSFIYNSLPLDLVKGEIDFDGDDFKIMLVDGSYVASKSAHSRRSDVSGESSGTGYTAGGQTVACSVTAGIGGDSVVVTLDTVEWLSATVSAAGAVIYVDRGGASSGDELVAFVDFGALVSSTNATFSVTASTITLQN